MKITRKGSTVIMEAGVTAKSRELPFTLLGIQLKKEIHGSAATGYAVAIPIGPDNRIELSQETRAGLEQAVDAFMKLMIERRTAKGLYLYFASLAHRAKHTGFEVVGDLITKDGVFNADSIVARKQ